MIARSPLEGIALAAAAIATLFLLRIAANGLGIRFRGATWTFLLITAFAAAGSRLFDARHLVPALDAGSLPGVPAAADPDPFAILSDVQLQLVPWEVELRRLLGERAFSLWSPRLAGGSCLGCNPQAQAFAPIAWLARPFPLLDFFLVAWVLKVLVAAAGATTLARAAGLRESIARWAGATFALSGGMAAWALFPLSSTLAFVPWVVAAAVRIARASRGEERSSLVVGALSVAALWLSGHPETAVAGLGLAALAAGLLRRRRRHRLRAASRLATAAVAGTLLAAPLLLPFAAAAHDSIRREDLALARNAARAAPLAPVSGPDLALARSPLGPDVFGRPYRDSFRGPYNWPIALGFYCGLQALAGLTLLGGEVRRRALPFVLYAGASLLFAVRFLPFELVRSSLPFARDLTPDRLLPTACLALTIAAAFGWQRGLRRGFRPLPVVAAGLALSFALALAPTGRTVTEATVAAALLVLASGRTKLDPRATARFLVGSQLVLLASWGWALLPSTPAARARPETPELGRLRENAARQPAAAVIGSDFEVYPNVLPRLGIRDVRFHDPLARADVRAVEHVLLGFAPSVESYFSPVRLLRRPTLERLGICCVVAHREHEVPLARQGVAEVVELGDDRRLLVVEPNARPVAAVAELHAMGDRREVLEWLATDPPAAESARLTLADALPASETPPVARIDEARFAPDGLVVRGSFPEGSILRVAVAEPGRWSVEPPSVERERWTLDAAFLGIRTRAFQGEIRLRYRPFGRRAGFALALGSAVALALFAARSGRRTPPSFAPRR